MMKSRFTVPVQAEGFPYLLGQPLNHLPVSILIRTAAFNSHLDSIAIDVLIARLKSLISTQAQAIHNSSCLLLS